VDNRQVASAPLPRRRRRVPSRSADARPESATGAPAFLPISKGKVRYAPGWLLETHGAGIVEPVTGFDAVRALAAGMGATQLTAPLKKPTVRGRPALPAGELRDLTSTLRPQSVIDTDDRVPVRTTAGVPWRSICCLRISYEHGGTAIGTGFFIGPRAIATAGHNVVRQGRGRASRIEVIPGLDRREAPFGVHVASAIDYDPDWTNGWLPEHDLGCVYLSDAVGLRTGVMALASVDDVAMAELGSALLNNAGYDDDKAPLGTMWFNAGRLAARGIYPRWLEYLLDTEAGQSGSPVFHTSPTGARTVLAIHVYGDRSHNIGLRITPRILSMLRRWAKT
jgi:V8-like Glu-specific endopeptidase